MVMSEKAQIRHVLKDSQIRVFEKIRGRLNRLNSSSIPRQEGSAKQIVTIRNKWGPMYDKEGRIQDPKLISQKIETPSDDDLAALARHVRVFILEKEDINLLKVIKQVRTAFSKAGLEIPTWLDQIKQAWKLEDIIESFDSPRSGQEFLDLWFNAEDFHGNDVKKSELDRIKTFHSKEAVLVWVRLALAQAMSVLFEFGRLIENKTDIYDGSNI